MILLTVRGMGSLPPLYLTRRELFTQFAIDNCGDKIRKVLIVDRQSGNSIDIMSASQESPPRFHSAVEEARRLRAECHEARQLLARELERLQQVQKSIKWRSLEPPKGGSNR